MERIERSVDLEASAQRVWDVLVDFRRYPEWNPFIVAIAGDAVPGARLEVRLQPPGGRAMNFRPRVLAATPAHELRWLGRILVPGLFDGEHRFVIEPRGEDRCHLVHGETFRGVLVPLLKRGLGATAEGFEQMNRALAARVRDVADDTA